MVDLNNISSPEEQENMLSSIEIEIRRIFSKSNISILIDHSNLEFALKKLKFRFDYEKFRRTMQFISRLRGIYCFISVVPNDTKRSGFISFLEYNGYRVVRKDSKLHIQNNYPDNVDMLEYRESDVAAPSTELEPVRRVKGNVDVELTIYALEHCPQSDHIVLLSGDGDFRMLVEQLQRSGKEVSVISTIQTHPPVISDELRRQADNFIDLDDLRLMFEK